MSSMILLFGIWMCGAGALFCLGALVGARLQRAEYSRRWRKVEEEIDELEQRLMPYR